MRYALHTLALAACAALPGVASSQIAGPFSGPIALDEDMPTLAECQSARFLERASWLTHTRCVSVLGESLAIDQRAARIEGRLSAVDVPRIGVDGPLAEAVGATRIEPRLGGWAINDDAAERLAYELNGNAIESCDEFIYQKHYTWSRFRQEIASAPSARAVFDFAYGGDRFAVGRLHVDRFPHGSSPMARRKGTSSVPLWDPVPTMAPGVVPDLHEDVFHYPKNDYFALSDEELAVVRSSDRGLAAWLEAGRRYYAMRLRGTRSAHLAATYPTPWAWHHDMSDALADTPDAELRVLARRRAEFRGLLAHRRSLRAEGYSRWSVEVRAADRAMLDALDQAAADGCVFFDFLRYDDTRGVYDVSRCDWAPEDFLPAVSRQLEPAIEIHRVQCEADFPTHDVSSGYDYRTRSGRADRSGIDALKDSYQVDLYLRRMRDTRRFYVGQFAQAGRDGAGPLVPHYQKAYADNETFGDRAWAAVSYAYDLGYGLADRVVDGFDDVNPHAHGHLSVTGTVLRRDFALVEAGAGFDLRREARYVDLQVLGQHYLEYDWERRGGARQAELSQVDIMPGDPSRSLALDGTVEHTLFIAGVPLTLEGGPVGRVGLEVDGDADGAAFALMLRPFARLDARAAAGVGVSGLSGGAYLEVNLIDAGVPVRVEGHARAREVEIDVHAELELASLSGEVGGYVEFPRICFFGECIGGRYSKTFFDWPQAIEHTVPLFEQRWAADLPTWIEVCARDGVECANEAAN